MLHFEQQVEDLPFRVGWELLKRYEHILQTLGEDGVKPFARAAFEQKKEQLVGKGFNPNKPLVMETDYFEWSDQEKVPLNDLKIMLPRNETIVLSYIEVLQNLNIRELKRNLLLQASWDRALLREVDDSEHDRVVATRLQSLPNYGERKAYVLALSLMEFQE